MRYTRIYADDTGETHLEEVDIELELAELAPPAPPFDLSAALPATRMLFAALPVGWFGDWHPAPCRQFFLQLTGEVEVVVSDGGRVQTGAGSVTLLEDVKSKGHATRVVGDSPVTGAFVQLAG